MQKWCSIFCKKTQSVTLFIVVVKNILWKWCWFNQGVSHLVSSRISTLFWRSCGWRGQKSSTHWHIPHPSISYPAFSIHFTFALLQGFLEHGLVSLAAQFLLSTDTDTWWPSGCQSFRQASHTVTSSDIYGLNIKFKQSDFFYVTQNEPENSTAKQRRAKSVLIQRVLLCVMLEQ